MEEKRKTTRVLRKLEYIVDIAKDIFLRTSDRNSEKPATTILRPLGMTRPTLKTPAYEVVACMSQREKRRESAWGH